MKKLVTMVLALCMVLALLSGCTASPSDDGTNGAEENTSLQNKDGETKDDGDSDNAGTSKVAIEETVIYDENDIKITAKDIYETENSFGLSMLLENHSDKKASFYLSHCIINGFAVQGLYGELAAEAGKEDLTSIVFAKTDLEYLGKKYWGIDSIATIAGVNGELTVDGKTISVPFTLTTSAGVGYEPTFDDSGDTLYEKDGLTVIYKEVTETEEGDALTLLVINKTGKDVIIESVDGAVNGNSFGLPLWNYAFRDAVSCCHIILDSSSLEDRGIDKVENVRFVLGITDPETYQMVAKSDEIEIAVTE